MQIAIENGTVLADGVLVQGAPVAIAGGIIAALDSRLAPAGERAIRLDASGLHVLPGIIDVHGDAFERSIMPRPGVTIDTGIALAEMDRGLAAHGITTAYLSLTATWEPGLRDIQVGRDIVAALTRSRATMAADVRLHVRWETYAFDVLPDVIGWLDLDPKPLLSFNDHTTTTLAKRHDAKKLAKWADRSGLSPVDYMALVERVASRESEVQGAVANLARRARERGIVTMSHDDQTVEVHQYYRALGASVCEFPLTLPVIEEARAMGEPTVLGAPNILRGGSHTGALDAAEMVDRGLCTVLASDYFYPAQLHAAFKLVRTGLPLERVWPLVSSGPAEAAGLTDRGTIALGKRADVLLVDARGPVVNVVAAIAGGRLVHLTRGDILR